MTINVALAPEGVSPAHQARAQLPVLSAAGVSDGASLARQQLPSAVPALALVAAYNANPPPLPKPVRPFVATAPSSALAAQFIAQGAVASEEDLAIFVPRQPAPTVQAEPDFLQAMRAARGESAMPAPTQTSQTVATLVPSKPDSAALSAALGTSLTQLAAGLPSLLVQPIKRLTIFSARGFGAYQLTLKRNEALSTKTAPTG